MPVAKKPRKPPAAKPAEPALPDRRAMETYLDDTDDDALDDALEKAQEILSEAMDRATARSRVTLARKALAVCPLCADAYNLLAREAATQAEARDLYERGLAAGELELGAENFDEYAGHFWLASETRPYMRARHGLALTLLKLGEEEAAVEHFRAMLKLNPGDNQGIRYLLLGSLVRRDAMAEVKTLLGAYPDEGSMYWAYTRALVAYRDGQGSTPDTMKCLADARKGNAHVPDLLASAKLPKPSSAGFVTAGGAGEAADYAREFGDAWRKTPGAVEWLKSSISALEKA